MMTPSELRHDLQCKRLLAAKTDDRDVRLRFRDAEAETERRRVFVRDEIMPETQAQRRVVAHAVLTAERNEARLRSKADRPAAGEIKVRGHAPAGVVPARTGARPGPGLGAAAGAGGRGR